MNSTALKWSGETLADASLIDAAIRRGVREALLRHKLLGHPIAPFGKTAGL